MGETQTVVYKVIIKRWWHDKFTSAAVTTKRWMLNYELGKTTRPKKGYIFAFDTLQHARLWRDSINGNLYTIIESEAIIADAGPVSIAVFLSNNKLEEFWDGQRPYGSTEYNTPPQGTVWCSELTPIRVIEGDGYVHYDES